MSARGGASGKRQEQEGLTVNAHIKTITKPRLAQIGQIPFDALVLKGFVVDVLTAVDGLFTRKNAIPGT